MGSKSARSLSSALNGLQVYPDRKFKPRLRHILINWGSTCVPKWYSSDLDILNKFENVNLAKDKLQTFNTLKNNNISCVDFTTDRQEAESWLEQGYSVYCRQTTTGFGGQGIVIATDVSELVNAKLYTKAINIRAEYRVHVFNGEVIAYVKKRRHLEDEPTELESRIRNHSNGWIFTRENLKRLERVEDMAIQAVKALGLDFGAVDIVRGQDNTCYVLEVNTACGLEGTTLENYKQAILKHYGSR
jgi:glutathione synthase/RimK-type ligase-like ATP-grasp enzyme